MKRLKVMPNILSKEHLAQWGRRTSCIINYRKALLTFWTHWCILPKSHAYEITDDGDDTVCSKQFIVLIIVYHELSSSLLKIKQKVFRFDKFLTWKVNLPLGNCEFLLLLLLHPLLRLILLFLIIILHQALGPKACCGSSSLFLPSSSGSSAASCSLKLAVYNLSGNYFYGHALHAFFLVLSVFINSVI
jgi:hypothetical protein